MKKALRWIVPVVGVVAVVALFVLLRPGEEDVGTPTPSSTTTVSPSGTSTSTESASPTPTGSPTASPSPESTVSTIEVSVVNGVVRGPGEFEVTQGDDVVILIHADVSDEVHLHGYDLTADVTPDSPARISFTADAPGIYEVELESAGLLLFELKVTR
jgi:hypothetical protein